LGNVGSHLDITSEWRFTSSLGSKQPLAGNHGRRAGRQISHHGRKDTVKLAVSRNAVLTAVNTTAVW
jgi:hypothetical protein